MAVPIKCLLSLPRRTILCDSRYLDWQSFFAFIRVFRFRLDVVLPALSFLTLLSSPRSFRVSVPCSRHLNCQWGVLSFHTLPWTTAKPCVKAQACRRSRNCALSLKGLFEVGSSSQAGGKDQTWRSHTGFTCSGSCGKVGWLSSSAAATRDIVKEQQEDFYTKIGDSEVRPPQGISKPLCGFVCVGFTIQFSHVWGQPINGVGIDRGGCWM